MRIYAGRKALVVAIVLITLGYFLFNSDWFQREYIYPFPCKDIVFRYALKNDLDPYLVAAMIRTESKFIPNACSPKGAIGLMQMMPETAKWAAKQNDYQEFTTEMLQDPETNICLGTWYLESLLNEFKNNQILALAAYNGGRGNVKKWIKQFGWTDDFHAVDQIPFGETREYVKKVLDAESHYRELYGL